MSPDDFRRLVAAGMSTEQIAIVMEMIDAKDRVYAEAEEARKSKGRERVAKWREQRNVTETSQNITVPLMRDRVAPVEDNSKTTDTDKVKKNTTAADLAAFKGVLASLDAVQVDGLISIRRKKRGSLTGYAAQLFVKDAANCKLTLSEAADVCIRRNWLTIEPDWLVSNQSRGSPPTKPISASQLALNRAQEGFRNAESPTERDDRPALVLISQLSERGR